MTIFTLFLIAFSLAMDAFAIAVANGVAHRGAKSQALYPALAFGLAQGIMPVLGYVLGSGFTAYFAPRERKSTSSACSSPSWSAAPKCSCSRAVMPGLPE